MAPWDNEIALYGWLASALQVLSDRRSSAAGLPVDEWPGPVTLEVISDSGDESEDELFRFGSVAEAKRFLSDRDWFPVCEECHMWYGGLAVICRDIVTRPDHEENQ